MNDMNHLININITTSEQKYNMPMRIFNGIYCITHRNGEEIMLGALVFTGDVEAYLQYLLWLPGQSCWWFHHFCDASLLWAVILHACLRTYQNELILLNENNYLTYYWIFSLTLLFHNIGNQHSCPSCQKTGAPRNDVLRKIKILTCQRILLQ